MRKKGFLSSMKGKVMLSVFMAALGITAVIFTAFMLSTKEDFSTVLQEETNYGEGYTLENASAPVGNALKKTSLDKQKVTLVLEDGYQEAAQGTNEDLIKWRDEQIDQILSENGLTAYDLANYGDQIESSIMQQIDHIIKKYEESVNAIDPVIIRGEDGKDGKDGEDGIQGATGLRGPAGPAGAAGKTGQTGQRGIQGIQGVQGERGLQGEKGQDGVNGKSTYIAYAESSDGSRGFSKTPTNQSRYIGTCITEAATAPSDPKNYVWQEYKDYIITYDESTNTLLITN